MLDFIKGITCVNVIAEFTKDGTLIPMAIRWEDGRIFEIDRVLTSNKCIGPRTSKTSQRYKCIVAGHERFLFYEANGQWFVENQHALVEEC